MEVLGFTVQLVLDIALTAWIVRRDERRLDGARLARSWPVSSLWAAVVVFGPLCIPVHYVRTRRTLGGFLLGISWMVAAFALLWMAAAAFEWLSTGAS